MAPWSPDLIAVTDARSGEIACLSEVDKRSDSSFPEYEIQIPSGFTQMQELAALAEG